MPSVIKLRKGLDIKLKGRATNARTSLGISEEYALVPDDFPGISPKVIVKEGDHVKAGDALFVCKTYPNVKFASPVSGSVTEIVRGDRRKVLCVKVHADVQQEYVDFEKKDPVSLGAQEVRDSLLESGLFGYINQLPYAISTNPETEPKAIFISALRDMPLAGDFEIELERNEAAFQAGLTALSKISRTYLGIGPKMTAKALTAAKDVKINIFDGPCPAGNVGVQVNHLCPVNKGELVWLVDPTAVIFFGRLFLEGKVNLTRTIAVAGSKVTSPHYVEALVGTPLKSILKGRLSGSDHIRIINGNPLTGKKASLESYLGAHVSEICVIPEGDNTHEILGWILPRMRQFSMNRSYFSWMRKNKEYDLDARIKGGERHMIMSGEYDRVIPMDIYAEFLIKAIIAGDIERQEELGIYEISPEDFAIAEFVDSSKLPLQEIIRKGLDTLRKENA